jgi:hypothetical protein
MMSVKQATLDLMAAAGYAPDVIKAAQELKDLLYLGLTHGVDGELNI